MKYYSKKQWTQKLTVMVLLAMALGGTAVQAMPSGADIRSGQGSVSQDGKNMTIQQNSQRMAIDWTKFDINKDETVRYAQPDRNAISLNRVTGGQQSVIAGNLNANGNVVLVNPNGVVFTKNSSVDVGGLVASTARLNDEAMKNFGNGKDSLGLSLDKDSTASVINEGQIKAQGGLVALHAANVENSGTITNEGGTIAMAAAKNLTLSAADDDKLNFTVDGELAKAQALNNGSLKADGGYVIMTAKSAGDVLSTVVNNTGTIEAKTLRKNEKGQIFLDGGDNGQVEVSGTLDASGTEAGQDAGNIKVIGEKTIVHDNTNLLARGDVDGGKIETSGDVLNLGDNLNIDAKGVNGKAGEWLLDPLEILIQDDQPTQGTGDRTIGTVNEGSGTQITYNDPPSPTQNANSTYNSTSWIATHLITDILNKGTDVTIQAASTSQAASITVNSAIKPKVEGDGEATLTLEAQRNITINKEIAADESGSKLNVKLNSDTDGDGVGAVIINADISTNGGTFTSGSGGNVSFEVPKGTADGAYADTGLKGQADIAGHTVGTYFGYVVPEGKSAIDLSGEQNNRKITTNGGAITLDGEVAIGLNGGVLTLDTSKKDGTPGGAVNITGIVNSGNSYDTYIYGTDKWNELVKDLVQQYLKHNSVPSYRFVGINYTKNEDGTYSYTTEAKSFKQGESHYAFHELKSGDVNGSNWTYTDSEATLDTQHTRWYTTTTAGTGYNSFIMEGTTPETSQMSIDEWLIYYRRTEPANYATKYANGNTDTKTNLVTYEQIQNDPTRMATLKSDISALIAHNWFASKELAQSGTGANPGDSYLATITTALENSLSTPNSQKTLWVGGRGSGIRNKTNDTKNNPYSQYPSDPSYQDGFYWVTGPEGLVKNEDGTTGTKFWDTSKSFWNSDLSKSNYGEQVYGYTKWSSWSGGGQPDNSAPFLTVGYGNNNAWDDAAIDGGTTVGFVQETNLYNSSLNIKTAGGKVTLQGDLGKSVGLDTVKIDAGNGDVITGNTDNKATQYNHGTIYADHGVYISGDTVNVGGEIHSGGTNVEATRNTDDSFKDYLDNVTIQSSGNLTVHGIEVNTSTNSKNKTTSRTDGEGGKIKLTSTGTNGVITLGDGVDYNGKNTNGGVLKAASTANDSVVIDAQGSNGAFMNKTTAEKAIDTQGNWQVYSASPDNDTFGTNLNSGTDALWTAKSDSNTIATKNKYGIVPLAYSTVSGNKFIFQATPVITLSSEDYLKTYGDEVSADTLNRLLKGRETFTGLDGETHNVTDYSSAFQEQSYKNYIDGKEKVTITSDGSAAAATRTGGQYEATEKSGADGNKAVYDLTVNLNGAQPMAGYAIATENGRLEISKKALTINTNATQTYGDATVITGTPSDYSGQLVNGDTLTAGDIAYAIAAGGSYAASKGTNTTAHAGSYDNQYLTTGATVKARDGSDASANYEVTGSGTITVTPADLYLTVGDVSTTYGTPFKTENYKYTIDTVKGGLVNGDTSSTVLGDNFLSYTNTGVKTDASNVDVKTQNAGTYELQGAASKDLSDYTVHIANGTSTVNKAKLTLTVGDTSTVYGSDAWTPYTYTLEGNANGDTVDDVKNHQIAVTYTNGGVKSDASNANVKTQDVGSYALNGEFTLSGDTDTNYEIDTTNSKLTGKATVIPAEIHLRLNGVSTIYGTAFDTSKYGYDASQLKMANGDSTDVVTKAITNGDITYTNTGDGTDGKATNHAGIYELSGKTDKKLTNYTVIVDDANSIVKKADITLQLKDVSTTYGTPFDENTYGYNQDTDYLKGILENGDDASVVTGNIKNDAIHYNNTGAVTDAGKNKQGIYTADAGKDYTVSSDDTVSLQDYNVTFASGNSTVNKAKLTLTVGNTETTYGSDAWTPYTYTLQGNTNGDTADFVKENGITVAYTNTGAITDASSNAKNIYTKDANGDYQLLGDFTLTGQTAKNYEIQSNTPGKATVNKATVKVKLNDVSTTYGTAFDTSKYGYDPAKIEGLTNGDGTDVVTNVLDGTYGIGDITYTNTGDASEAEKQAGKVTKR